MPALAPAPASHVEVGSTLVALARTLDSDQLAAALGLTTLPAPEGQEDAGFGAIELSGEERYTSAEALGEGGMGRVTAVWDRDLMRELALKQLHPRLAGDAHSLRQFLWEARVNAHLDHPNVVPIHDLGLDQNGALYFTMKRVRGRSLAELIESLGALSSARLAEVDGCDRCTPKADEDPLLTEYGPRRRRLRIFVEICQAIAYAHERGVLHRDLKPANVMIGEFGQVLVMDWGLATPRPDASCEAAKPLTELMPEALRETDERMYGTPRYMAPELLHGQAAGVRSDVYALGIILYELMAFRRPHDADSVPALVARITEGEFTPLAQVAPRVPRSVVAVVEKAMATDPLERYASVAALLDDVEAVLAGLTPGAEEVSHLTWVRRYFWSRDNPMTGNIRLVDLDLMGGAGLAMGVALTLAWTRGIDAFVIGGLVLGAALLVSPAVTYMRAVRIGKRDFAKQRERV